MMDKMVKVPHKVASAVGLMITLVVTMQLKVVPAVLATVSVMVTVQDKVANAVGLTGALAKTIRGVAWQERKIALRRVLDAHEVLIR